MIVTEQFCLPVLLAFKNIILGKILPLAFEQYFPNLGRTEFPLMTSMPVTICIVCIIIEIVIGIRDIIEHFLPFGTKCKNFSAIFSMPVTINRAHRFRQFSLIFFL